jgi:hypothetical protein
LWSGVLALPVLWPYLSHWLAQTDTVRATGFLQVDMPSYMAHAREYFDAGGLTYGNPSSPFYDTPAIYFQPMTLFLGAVWRVTGLDPGLIFVLFGLVAAVVCIRMAMALYRRVVGLERWTEWLGLVVFVWGGGVLVLAGVAYGLATGDRTEFWIFRFDPHVGWWFLNFGRNMYYPTEGLYHALFLACIVCVLVHRYGLALLVALITSASHPFTGVQLLVILCVWTFIERYFLENRRVPWPVFLGFCALLALHLGYYLWFLNLFPEHRALMELWAQAWVYRARNFVPAYILVGGLAVWQIRRVELARAVFSRTHNRLFLVWFVVSFLLANHEFAMRAVQPIHFTRGYVWMPLFLLGAPALVHLFDHLWSRWRRAGAALAITTIMAVFLTDNALWLGSARLRGEQAFYLSPDEKELFQWLSSPQNRGFVLLGDDRTVTYLATVYTPLRSWYSHQDNTPDAHERRRETREFFEEGVFLDRWRTTPLLIVESTERQHGEVSAPPAGVPASLVYENPSFTVLRVEPAMDDATEGS